MEESQDSANLTCDSCQQTFQRLKEVIFEMEPHEVDFCDGCIKKSRNQSFAERFAEIKELYDEQVEMTSDVDEKEKCKVERRIFLQKLISEECEK